MFAYKALIIGALAGWILASANRAEAEIAEPLAAFDAAWEAYATETNGKGLQFGCQPRRYRPPPGVERIGAVVAFHGFSACPQQQFLHPEVTTASGRPLTNERSFVYNDSC